MMAISTALLLTVFVSQCASTPQNAPRAASPNFWFSFGETVTETGFSVTGTLPSVGNPTGNPPFPGFAGLNYVDIITTQLNHSLVFNYDFATSGATIDPTIRAPQTPVAPATLVDQVSQFLSVLGNKPASTPWTSANALFSFWFGVNDIFLSYASGTTCGAQTSLNALLISSYFTQIGNLYAVGARNFLFINVYPLDRNPFMLANPLLFQTVMKTDISDFNTQFLAAVNNFKSTHSGVTTFFWDSNAAFTTVLNNPTAFNFTNIVGFPGSRAAPAPFFWLSDFTPGVLSHEIWAKDIAAVLGNAIW